jgi:hypothetical protein
MCNVISEEETLEIKKKNAVLIKKQEKSDDEHDPSLYDDPREYSRLHDSKLLIKGLDELTQLEKLVIREELAEKNQESLKVLKGNGVKVDIRRFSF